MAFIRGQERLVFRAMGEYLLVQLDALGWFNAQAPYGAVGPLTLLDYVPAKHEELKSNTLALTEGPELRDEEGELGAAHGGLFITPTVYFIDIYGESLGVTQALCSDVKAILQGRLPGTNRYQQVKDHTQVGAPYAPGHYIHFDDIEVETPSDQGYKRTWRVVKVMVHHEYNATEVVTQVPVAVPGGYTGSYAGSY